MLLEKFFNLHTSGESYEELTQNSRDLCITMQRCDSTEYRTVGIHNCMQTGSSREQGPLIRSVVLERKRSYKSEHTSRSTQKKPPRPVLGPLTRHNLLQALQLLASGDIRIVGAIAHHKRQDKEIPAFPIVTA